MPPDTILDSTLRLITNALENYSLQIGTFATRIALALALLQGCIAIYYAWGNIQRAPSIIVLDMIRRMIPIFIILWALSNVGPWGNGFFDGYNAFASTLAGGVALTPSSIFDIGLRMVSTIASARSLGMWLWGAISLEDLFFAVFCLVVITIWASIAWLYLFVALEMVAYVVAGPLIVCWGPLDQCWGSAMSWVRQIISTGTKVIVLSLLLGGIILLANQWQDVLNTSPINSQRTYWETVTMIEAMISFFIVHAIPNKVAALITVDGAAHGSHDDGAYNSARGWVGAGVRTLGI
jgi:hypothetical protein